MQYKQPNEGLSFHYDKKIYRHFVDGFSADHRSRICPDGSRIPGQLQQADHHGDDHGVYIPADLEDAFSELNRLSDPRGVAEFKSAPEDSIRRKLHFGLGKWILVNWGLEDGSRYSHHLKQKGISIPDDMVEYTIVMWHRKLNSQPLKSEEEIARIQKRMAEDQKKRDEDKKIISVEKKPHKE